MSKRVVQSVIVFAVAIVFYLLYSAVVKDDDKAAPAEERAEPQDNSAVIEDVEADTAPVITKVDEPTAAKSPEPTVPTFVEVTPKAAVIQKPKRKKQDKEPEVAVETIEPTAEKAASVIEKSIDDSKKSSLAKSVMVEKSSPVAVDDKVEEAPKPAPTVVVQAKISKVAVKPVPKVEKVPVSAVVAPKTVIIREPETVKYEVEQETAAAETPFEDMPAVKTAAVAQEAEVADKIETTEQELAAVTEPVAEKVSLAAAASTIGTEKAVDIEESLPIAVEEKGDDEAEDLLTVDETPVALAGVEQEVEKDAAAVIPVAIKEEPDAAVEVVPVVETTAVLADTPEVEVADKKEEIKEEPEAAKVSMDDMTVEKKPDVVIPEETVDETSIALAAVTVQAEVSKEAAAPVLTVETVAASAIVIPEAVPVQEPEAVKYETEPEIAVTVVEPEVEKDLEAEAVAVVPVVETAAVLAVTTETVAVVTVPVAENTTPAVATPIIETAKVVSTEESLPVAVEEKVDTSVLEQQRDETEELLPVETNEDIEAAVAVETTLVLVVAAEAEVTDKSGRIEQEKEPEAVTAVTVPAAEQVVIVEESLPVMKEEKVEGQEKIEVEADVAPVVMKAEKAVITETPSEEKAGASALISAVVAKETVETEQPEITEEEKKPKTVATVFEQEPEKAAPVVVKLMNDSKQETPKPRTQEDEKKAKKTYANYGKKAAVLTPKAEVVEEEMLLYQHVGYFTRDRNGVDGLGRLQESKMLIALGVKSGQNTYGVDLNMVQLESGRLKIADSGLYGTDGTVVVGTPSESEGGSAISLNYRYEQKSFAVSGMVGMTPSVSNDISAAPLWDVAVEGNFDVLKAYGRFVQRAVVDSLLSSVGNSDLYTQQVWGRVIKQGVEAGVRLGEEYKFAWDLGYYPVIKGKNTLENSEITTTVSVVKPIGITSIDRIDAGLLLAYDDYEFDSEHYTYGHGGYFSPQSYMRSGMLFDMTQQFSDSILFDARASVGYTSYKNDAVEKHPFEAGAEMYAADSSKFISAETAVFLGLALGDSAQVMTGAGYSNHTNTNEYFLSVAIHIYLQEHQMSRKDFVSIDRFSNVLR